MTYFAGKMERKHMSALALYKTLATEVSPPTKKARLQVNVSRMLLERLWRSSSLAVDRATPGQLQQQTSWQQGNPCLLLLCRVVSLLFYHTVLFDLPPNVITFKKCCRYQINRRRKRNRRMGPSRLTHLKPSQRVKRERWQRRLRSLLKERRAVREEPQ